MSGRAHFYPNQNKMITSIYAKLHQLDPSLNELLLRRHQDDSGLFNLNSLKDGTEEATFVLFNISLVDNIPQTTSSWPYIRGFERKNISHPGVCDTFLDELRLLLPEFEIPRSWKKDDENPSTHSILNQNLNLIIEGRGGGYYTLPGRTILLYGYSYTFGQIMGDDLLTLDRLLNIGLLRHPSGYYSGYKVDYSSLISR